MEISFAELKEKEVINVFDGKKLGRIVDIVFDHSSGEVKGIVVPGERKIFHKTDDIFISLSRLKRIGDDVILVTLGGVFNRESSLNRGAKIYSREPKMVSAQNRYLESEGRKKYIGQSQSNNNSYIRFKRLDNKKYK